LRRSISARAERQSQRRAEREAEAQPVVAGAVLHAHAGIHALLTGRRRAALERAQLAVHRPLERGGVPVDEVRVVGHDHLVVRVAEQHPEVFELVRKLLEEAGREGVPQPRHAEPLLPLENLRLLELVAEVVIFVEHVMLIGAGAFVTFGNAAADAYPPPDTPTLSKFVCTPVAVAFTVTDKEAAFDAGKPAIVQIPVPALKEPTPTELTNCSPAEKKFVTEMPVVIPPGPALVRTQSKVNC